MNLIFRSSTYDRDRYDSLWNLSKLTGPELIPVSSQDTFTILFTHEMTKYIAGAKFRRIFPALLIRSEHPDLRRLLWNRTGHDGMISILILIFEELDQCIHR
ncbi:hypothetical protein D3C81_1870300 [compost metagenome]